MNEQKVPFSADVKTKREKNDRNNEKSIQKYRLGVQIAFALLCIWIGVELHSFVKALENGGVEGVPTRPPGVEGFLPISSLMSLYFFFLTGEIHPAHPAGLFILVAILLVSLVFGKAFCAWLCPIGLISETIGDLGEKLFRKKLKLPRFLDYPLRSLKYLLLAFFLWAIFIAMNQFAISAFLDSPYNQVADIKMYYFFAEISRFSLIVILALFVLSFVIRNFWCRFLCPYGALLGIFSIISPNRIKRNEATCIDCAKCAEVCPSFIKVDTVKTVISDECTSCMQCVDVCPVADTLEIKPIAVRRKVPKIAVAILTVAIFTTVTGLAMLAGKWQNNLTAEEYLYHQRYLKGYGHPTGTAGFSSPERNQP